MSGKVTDDTGPVKVTYQNPWNKSGTSFGAESCSLSQVMSEQLAQSLVDEASVLNHFKSEELPPILGDGEVDTTSDLIVAQLLQQQYDKEYDCMVKQHEKKRNGKSKVSVSLTNYLNEPREVRDESDDEDDSDDENRRWDSFEAAERTTPTIGKSGFVKTGTSITTKHDAAICGRRNACKIMEFHEIETGDGGGFDMKVSNAVFNTLKVHNANAEKRLRRIDDKSEKSTMIMAIDQNTKLKMFKLVNSGILESISGVVSTGKESVVFHAKGGTMNDIEVPEECAIKAYKTTQNEFKNRAEYTARRHKPNARKVITLWAEKEMLNLKRINKAGIPCPKVVVLRKNLLVMQFIGKDQVAAPKLKDLTMTGQLLRDVYDQTVQIMVTLYEKCKLVHADFSEFNLLWHDGKVWVIDVSQSVDLTHPNVHQFLFRDCSNVYQFFTKLGLEDVLPIRELFNKVSGIDLNAGNPEILQQLKVFDKNKDLINYGNEPQSYNFEFFLESLNSNPDIFPRGLLKEELTSQGNAEDLMEGGDSPPPPADE